MVTWIVVAVCVVALLILALAVRPVLARVPRLHRAARRLRQREEQALGLQGSAAVLEETLAGLQERGLVAQERLMMIKAGRGGAGG